MLIRTMLIASLLVPVGASSAEPVKKDRPELSVGNGERQPIREGAIPSCARFI